MSETTEKSEGGVAAGSAEPQAPEPPTVPQKAPFALKPGARIELGPRRGRVTVLRGGGKKPYEVCVRWEGEKYPEWYLYSSLELAYENDSFKVL